MNRHVFIINENCIAAIYGIGTYIEQLISCLVNIPNISLNIIHISASVEKIEIKRMCGYKLYNIPISSIKTPGKIDDFQRNISYFIRTNFEYCENDKFVFIFNYSHHFYLVNHLKRWVPTALFYFVIHYQNWCFSLNSNVDYLKNIVRSNDLSSLSSFDQDVYYSVQNDKRMYQIVDKIICLSQFTLALLENVYGVSKDKLLLIYNGLKDEGKIVTRKEQISLRNRYSFSHKEKIILFVGRLDKIKGIDLLIRSFCRLIEKGKKYRLVIIGDGDYSSLLKCCNTFWGKITFVGHVEKKCLYDFYQMADVGVMPSLHEQCSFVAIEMMMFGLPLIVSKTSGLKEMVLEGVTGYTFNMEMDNMSSEDYLADLIEKILNSSLVEKKRIRRNSRFHYEEQYLLQDMKKKYLNLVYR